MGYDQERFVDDFGQDLVCSICLCVLEDPVECKTCQTNFCSACMDSWKIKSPKCPNNCELNLKRTHRFLRGVLNSLHLKCINTSFGCQQILTIETVSKHENHECLYRVVKCRYVDCDAMLLPLNIEEHERNCTKRVMLCEECGEKIKNSALGNHSCIESLSTKITAMLAIYTSNQKSLESLEEKFRDQISEQKGEIHHGTACARCGINPIIGIRNVCSQCIDYSLCWKCVYTGGHEHQFYELGTNDRHFGVTCDGCFNSPLKGIRYKCKICADFGNL